MIYGQFIEHFHRQVYGGVYDPGNPLSDEDGFRTDVIDALQKIQVPILRWPGGCFASAYHWKCAVGKKREPVYDKAWRVAEPGTFGTDEYIKFCNKVGCRPYICTNAGSGSVEEMSDWVEYCNLADEGRNARWRIENGAWEPHSVRYWSIGNENYDPFEIGAKDKKEWGRLVLESAKMMKSVDPAIELSAAALDDVEWNFELLKYAGQWIDWISIHKYWDEIQESNDYADYEASVAYTMEIETLIRRARSLLETMGLDHRIKIAFDEWNLRGWYHPRTHCENPGIVKEEYLYPRDLNDENEKYTMADAIFTACFLNTCNRNCDIVHMANFAPAINARGCIYTWEKGIVLRSTYHVFYLYVNEMGRTVIDLFSQEQGYIQIRNKSGEMIDIPQADVLATIDYDRAMVCISIINRSPDKGMEFSLNVSNQDYQQQRVLTLAGASTESYNGIGHDEVFVEYNDWEGYEPHSIINLKPHSVNIIQIR